MEIEKLQFWLKIRIIFESKFWFKIRIIFKIKIQRKYNFAFVLFIKQEIKMRISNNKKTKK